MTEDRPAAHLPLPAKAMRIGRTADNDMVVSDLDVSRHHAELRATDTGSYQIVDLGSHNGIFVNGRRVPSAVLADSDIVRLGNSTFRFARGELRQLTGSGEGTFAQDEPSGPDT